MIAGFASSSRSEMPPKAAKKNIAPATARDKKAAEKKNNVLVVSPSALWHEALPALPASSTTPTAAQINSLTEKGASLLEKDSQNYLSASSSSSSETTFFSKVIHSGTLSDRLSALTLLVQGSPLHNTKALETLKNMAGKGGGGRDESLKALRCIVDWWVGGGAPDRKLKCVCTSKLASPQSKVFQVFSRPAVAAFKCI